MSAIFGIDHRDGRPASEDALRRMDAALAGAFDRSGGLYCLGGLGFGRRTMAAAPASGCAGPRFNREEGLAFVAQGRIDNRREVLASLRAEGALFAGMGGQDLLDQDLLFEAYRRWGEAGLERLAGAFSFAAWHVGPKRLVLARSAIVAPPVFYHAGDDAFAFATMPRGLFALPEVPRRADRRMLALNLIRLSGPEEATLYHGVERLPTGSVLVWQGGRPRVRRWWGIPLDGSPPCRDEGEYADALGELLRQVVEEQMVERGPIGVMMSGGLDSTAVAAVAAAGPPRGIVAFSRVAEGIPADLVPPGCMADETPLVRDMAARHPGLDVRLIGGDTGFYLDDIDAVFRRLERHFSNAANLPWLRAILASARDAGVRVMLTGAQGNLTVSRGGGPCFAQALAEGRWRDAARHATTAGILSTCARLLPGRARRWLRGRRGDPLAKAARPWRLASAIHPDFARIQGIDDHAREWEDTYLREAPLDERPGLLRSLVLQDQGPVDHAFGSLYGVDLRHPLADPRIVRFCLTAPNRVFHAGGEPRSLIRRAMRDRVPDSILSNRLRGLQGVDTLDRLRRDRARTLEEIARLGTSDVVREMLDLDRMQELAQRSSGPPDAAGRLERQAVLVFGLAIGRFLCWLEREGVV